MKLVSQKWIFFLLSIFSIGSIVFLFYQQSPVLERFETHTYDLRFKALRGALPPHPDIAIIAINDKSIAELGRFPWSRHHYVDLINNVKAAGAKALLMDAFFPEEESEKADRAFAEALGQAGNVILAFTFHFNPDGSIEGKTGSIPLLSEAAFGEGHINFNPDPDGVNRRSVLVINDGGKSYPSLGLKGAMAGLGVTEFEQRAFEIVVGDRQIPIDGFGTMQINYTGPPGSYPIYSFADVAAGRVAPELLRGKVLFMGMTALGIYDMRVTPFHYNTPGVEINATIADNIMSGRFITRSGVELLIDIFFIVIMGVVVLLMTGRVSPKLTFPTFVLIAVFYIWFAQYMFVHGRWLSMVYPLTSALFAYIVSTAFHFMTLDRRSREIRSVFSSYVSRNVVDQLVIDPQSAKIGGETKNVTVLFLDVKGFTAISEEFAPAEVVKTLNEYLAALTRVIMEHDGTVDKFLGDGIMAYWGAPLAQERHAESAVECTLAMLDVSNKMALKYKKADRTPLSFRVGINSGAVIAGNIGLKGKKMEYTLIGDNVNLGARLEGAGKYYGVDVLVSQSTCWASGKGFLYRELDQIRVVGKKNAVRVYELIGQKEGIDQGSSATPDKLIRFAEGLDMYRSRDFKGAVETFGRLQEDYPDDRPSTIYFQRCSDFLIEPPPEDWDFVFQRKEK